MDSPILDYDNFFLPTDDLDQAKKFYHETLGLAVKFNIAPRRMTAFKVGKQDPAIILQEKSIYKDARPTILFVVEDVKKMYAELLAKGVKFLSQPYEIPTGWIAQFEDPSGNRLGITDYSKHKI